MNPKTLEHYMINIVYSNFSIISLGMIWLSFSNPKRRNWLIFNLYLLSFRQMFRMLDFENTKPQMEENQWSYQIAINVFAFIFTYQYINMASDENCLSQFLRISNGFSSAMMWFYASFAENDMEQTLENIGLNAKTSLIVLIVILVLVWKQKNINFSIISYITAMIR